MRHTFVMLVGATLLAGCASSTPGNPSALTGPTSIGANQEAGQALSLDQTHRHFDCIHPIVPVVVTASTNFAGLITTTIDDPAGCTLSPASQEAVTTPGSGGTKRATFTVNVIYGCTITFADKKGNTATLVTSYDASGSSCL